MTFTTEQLEEKYRSLPEVLKETMAGIETAETISGIGKKYQLHIDQIGELADEIGLVMLGLVKTEDFVKHLIIRLGLEQAVAEAMTREVNEQIFLKIRESLQALSASVRPLADSGETSMPSDRVETIASLPPPETAAIDLPKREEILDDIENPKATEEDSIFEQKMGKLFRIPREEVDLDPYLEKPK
ncbi:MAG: hypothetical protein AAB415_03290 [Patescibacteria group bacterium]